jgi:hypothetical protein
MPSGSAFRSALSLVILLLAGAAFGQEPTRVFIFAGQSNMVGTHSRVADIQRFPPFASLAQPQTDVLFSYKLGREEMIDSQGWRPSAANGRFLWTRT